MDMKTLSLVVALAPLAASVVVGLFGPRIGRPASHWLCILGVGASFLLSLIVWRDVQSGQTFNGDVYTWLASGDLRLAIGFLGFTPR